MPLSCRRQWIAAGCRHAAYIARYAWPERWRTWLRRAKSRHCGWPKLCSIGRRRRDAGRLFEPRPEIRSEVEGQADRAFVMIAPPAPLVAAVVPRIGGDDLSDVSEQRGMGREPGVHTDPTV